MNLFRRKKAEPVVSQADVTADEAELTYNSLMAAYQSLMASMVSSPYRPDRPALEAPADEEQAIITGWRAFSVLTPEYTLRGTRQSWDSREHTAVCRCKAEFGSFALSLVLRMAEVGAMPPGDPLPDSGFNNHTCGVYGLKEPPHVSEGQLVTACTFYGMVAEHAKGYRAEHARIERGWFVYGPDLDQLDVAEVVARVSERYGFTVLPISLADYQRDFLGYTREAMYLSDGTEVSVTRSKGGRAVAAEYTAPITVRFWREWGNFPSHEASVPEDTVMAIYDIFQEDPRGDR